MAKWRVAGINFDHFHMGDNLRLAAEHPDCEVIAICDEQPQRMQDAAAMLGLSDAQIFTDYEQCLRQTAPDIVLLCPAAARHGDWTERVAPFGCHVLVEKPFAASVAEADRMIQALNATGKQLAINWPLAWYPCHRTAERLVREGAIGELLQVHYYDGNRGPLWHAAEKVERTEEDVRREKPESWFYRRSHGGGSLQDYLGYGATLATWFFQGKAPLEVTAAVDQPKGLEVDEHAIVVARYDMGLSKFETRWGTFTDPWTHQPQPKCGFVLVGAEGTISSYDYEPTVHLQDRRRPAGRDLLVDELPLEQSNPIANLVAALEGRCELDGPLTPAISYVGQRIVDAAVRSADLKRTVTLESSGARESSLEGPSPDASIENTSESA